MLAELDPIPVQPVHSPEAAIAHSRDSADLEQLRVLLLGSDYSGLLKFKEQLQDPQHYTARVASVLAEAIQLRASRHDDALDKALTPMMHKSFSYFIQQDPKLVAEALYPVMGPAIRKSIHETLSQTLETFNQLLEQSLSVRSVRWRFDAWRTGRKYSEVVLMQTLVYQVEQVFLIHRETSLLLQHAVSKQAIAKDPDMVSSMLSAIQDFMADSFSDASTLNALRLGDLNVLVEQGPYVAIAAVVRGSAPADLRSQLIEILESVHQSYDQQLRQYSGDTSEFAALQPILVHCLKRQARPASGASSPRFAYALIGLIALGLGYWWYQGYVEAQKNRASQALWQQTMIEWEATPGIVILQSERTPEGYHVKALQDELAPQLAISDAIQTQFKPQFEFKPYISTEPSLVLKRAQQVLQPPTSVQLHLQDRMLMISGQAEASWIKQAKQQASGIVGISGLDSSQVRVVDPERELKALRDSLNGSVLAFERSSAELTAENKQSLVQLAQQLEHLQAQAQQYKYQLQVMVIGRTDAAGSEVFNRTLGLQRAQTVINALVGAGIPSELLMASVSVAKPNITQSQPDSALKGVNFQITLIPHREQ